MIKWGALVNPIQPYPEMVDLARKLESWGFNSFWYPDEKYYRDCYIGLTQVASATRKMRLGPCVTDPYSRHPISTAVSIGSLAELAPGRTILGLGAGGRGLAEAGIVMKKPVVALREAVEVTRKLLAGEHVDYNGEVISLHNLPLDFDPPEKVEILIGTGHGPLVQRLAGEIADLVMFANYASPVSIDNALQNVRAGVKRSGRKEKEVELISRVDVAVSQDRMKARTAVAPRILSSMRASYPQLTYLKHVPEFELSSKFIEIMKQKDHATKAYYADPDRSYPLIPKALFEHLAVAGTPEDVIRRLHTIEEMGVFSEITVSISPCKGQSLTEAFRTFAQEVKTAFE